MPRDYKSRAQSHSRRSQKKSLPGYIWLLSGLGIGLFVAFIIYLDKQPENETNFGDAVQLELEKLKQNATKQQAETDKQVTGKDDTDKTNTSTQEKKEQKFNFYTLLPELEVLIPKSETRPPEKKPEVKPSKQPTKQSTAKTNVYKPAKNKPVGSNKQYVLQVGSFQSLNDAEKLKANLAFLGLSANIQHVNINRQTWHRVRTGPYDNKQQLYKNQKKLKRNNISSISMELK
jgi:cell division protein FtsN